MSMCSDSQHSLAKAGLDKSAIEALHARSESAGIITTMAVSAGPHHNFLAIGHSLVHPAVNMSLSKALDLMLIRVDYGFKGREGHLGL